MRLLIGFFPFIPSTQENLRLFREVENQVLILMKR